MEKASYSLSEEEFENYRRLINRESGIFFDRGRKDILRLGLADRARARRARSLAEYFDMLTAGEDCREELRRLLAHLSIQETQFFRNPPQFDALRKFVLPEIIRRKVQEHKLIRIWSAGCSTGQEPYSVAMTVLDVLPDPESWKIQILGTDLNEDALEIARRGWYSERRLMGLDETHLERYFHAQDGGCAVSERVRGMVTFQRLNLVTDPLPIGDFGTCDVVFCRNVIIYFTSETAKYVVEHFFDILNPGGYLFLGHSETLWKMSAKYSLVEMGDAFIYRKPLPRSLEGRRFIPDRRIHDAALPDGIEHDRRRVDRERRQRDDASHGIPVPQAAIPRTREDADGAGEPDAFQLGRVQLELGDFDCAVKSFSEAITQEKTNPEAYFFLGIALERENRLDDAIEAYRKAIFCNEGFSLARFHLANVLERTGRLKGAILEYRNAARGFRENPPSSWESELEAFDLDSLVNLCEWKVESLSSLGA